MYKINLSDNDGLVAKYNINNDGTITLDKIYNNKYSDNYLFFDVILCTDIEIIDGATTTNGDISMKVEKCY